MGTPHITVHSILLGFLFFCTSVILVLISPLSSIILFTWILFSSWWTWLKLCQFTFSKTQLLVSLIFFPVVFHLCFIDFLFVIISVLLMTLAFFFFFFLVLSYRRCLYVLVINPLSLASFAYIFSHSVDCLFILFVVSFVMQKLLSLIKSHFFCGFCFYF